MGIMNKTYVFITSTKDRWEVPVYVIAEHRATHYMPEFGNDLARSLVEDTVPLFESNPDEIRDWAQNNMDWDEVYMHATRVDKGSVDMQKEWTSADYVSIM